MYTALLSILAILLNLTNSTSLVPVSFPKYLATRNIVAEETSINFSFGVKIPTNPSSTKPPSISSHGYHFPIPAAALSGNLISFLGNIIENQTTASQLTWLNPTAPPTIITNTSSTGVPGGNSSYSNATVSVGESRIVTATFSSGNSSSASAGAEFNTTSTSTSSNGNANSTATAVADAAGDVTIVVNATVPAASDTQSILNSLAAEAATSCAATSIDASSKAKEITTVFVPIDEPGHKNVSVVSTAYASCSAGVQAPVNGSSASSSGSQARLTEVASMVTCNGVESTDQKAHTTFRIHVVGKWSPSNGFEGAVTGQRVAVSKSHC